MIDNEIKNKVIECLDKSSIEYEEEDDWKMYHQNELYIWMVLLMVVCYCIPAMQLVFKYQNYMVESGNYDVCYYNFRCAIRTSNLLDFNHIFSNIAYIIFGIVFNIIVRQRYNRYKELKLKYKEINGKLLDKGVCQYFGIYHAMGLSLTAEGILSGIYHVCPTKENFQFDMTFMYVIAALMITKIYQFRHPETSSNAYKLFFGLSCVMLLGVIGIYLEDMEGDFTVFWAVLAILYLYVIMKLSRIISSTLKWRRPWQDLKLEQMKKLKNDFHQFLFIKTTEEKKKIVYQRETIFVIGLSITNLIIIIFASYKVHDDSNINMPDFLLFVFIINLMLYCGYYCVMKCRHKEKITIPVYIFAFFVIASSLPAGYLFTQKAKTTRVSHAVSRDMNQDCIVGMYDSHDLWHFLSAFALFSFFLLLLVIDDGIAEKPRNEIPIF